ncbi:MAG: ABC transporter permease, partial [Ruminococcus sp.]|nr:ABC transporter permease [Ruminococcus sp.]
MNNASYFKQTSVYFKKISRIAMREKAWKFIVFAFIIGLIVALVVSDKMFENFESTKSGFFTLASACIWLGIFNSIQSICKEHDIIRSEYRQGMKLSSYISANVMWQAVLCLAQSILLFVICIAFDFFSTDVGEGVADNGIGGYVEYFLTIFLLTFGSAVLGIMVSSISGNPTTAMTIMPFVLILQLIMCGVLFKLDGDFANGIANITFSKWGMSAFASTADMNSLESSIQKELPELASQLPDVGEDVYESTIENLVRSWGWCLGITVACSAISILAL